MSEYISNRIKPNPDFGLTDEEVQNRVREGLINFDTSIPTKTIPKIIKDNLFTLFNLINFILAAAVLYVGSYKNLLFMGVVISNIVISTYQEIRAKKTVDKLSLISVNKISVLRNGLKENLPINQIVLDDILILKQGYQIPTDCIIIKGECDVNESLLTGEPDSIHKKEGDILLSGSFIVSGSCKAQAEHVAENNYVSKISKDAKYVKKVNSQIMNSFNKIILYISILILPIGGFLFYNQFKTNNLETAVVNTTAALIGMIPEGLVLLTSTVLAVSVIRLAKHKVLVQELYCIETLARVDTLCLDKTGTITEGTMEISQIIPFQDNSKEELKNALSLLSKNMADDNPTFNAIKDKFENFSVNDKALECIPFSSEKKWSGVTFEKYGTIIIGAAEFILKDEISLVKNDIQKYSENNRVVLVAHSNEKFNGKNLPTNIKILGFVLLKDKIRVEAPSTLKYFKEQDVDVKIISGDNPITVANVAKSAGLKNSDKYVDASTLQSDEDIKNACEKYTIFGRVSPLQKKKLICALKEKGHTVAMVGDGVNDVLALKEADCSVAMASGSSAARTVSQLVLLNSNFSSMPKVVEEGRRSINNIQRSSSLFLVKTIYSTLLALLFLFIPMRYPFMPIQMTLTSVLTIGIPSFILALEPNKERITGNLFYNIISKSLPGALTIIFGIISTLLIAQIYPISTNEISTICVIITGFIGLSLLFKISTPFNLVRKILFSCMSTGFLISILFMRNLFSLELLNIPLLCIVVGLAVLSYLILNQLLKVFNKKFK